MSESLPAQELERRLAAALKTIDVLMCRVEDKVASGDSAFAVLEQNIVLERVVAERTSQLEAQRRQLGEALSTLQKTQSELIQAQKLESVGRLAAGIAHEINTPVQFVSDSVQFLREAFEELLAVLERYRGAARNGGVDPGPPDEAEEAQASAELDDFLREIPGALDRSGEGLERIARLVRSMKEFAHPGQTEKAPADLNRALETTLAVARNEYKYVADVETDYAELPPVTCHVGELNQVFLNLLVNAAHAIEAGRAPGDARKGLIRVSTRHEGDWVRVSISDTGTGIPLEIRERVYDPFFTTKEVGKGTGQGLSIARNIVVDKHGGTVSFDTEVGRGTTFHVGLPVSGPGASAAEKS